MKLIAATRMFSSGVIAILLGALALWIWTHAGDLAGALAASAGSPLRIRQAICALALAVALGAQAILFREVVPVFYAQRRGDEAVQVVFVATAVLGVLAAMILLSLGS
ncbi:MAG: hypothetical protein JO353_04495 [Phycisphaerae bacterium]|nr:hypothetical protein [Phycisphaerae bacterium]